MKKLMLNKETIANLSSREMNVLKGLTGDTCGAQYTCPGFTCVSSELPPTYTGCPVTGETCDGPTCLC